MQCGSVLQLLPLFYILCSHLTLKVSVFQVFSIDTVPHLRKTALELY